VTWIRKGERGLLSNAASLLACGLLAGIVVAAAAFPAVAMTGLAAKAGADTFDSLPGELDVVPPPQMSYVYASDGKTLLATLFDENRRIIAGPEMGDLMKQAMVASEDARFYEHRGVDVKGVARAFVANRQANGVSQGASTITMQYVRQAISYSAPTANEVIAATEDSTARKLREVKYAIALEKKLNKQEILERYLNIAPFGHGTYGVFAASQVYFNKAPKDLTLPEAALLAGLVKAPSAYDPADKDKLPAALERRVYVLDQMVKMGYITQAQADEAQKSELKVTGQRTPEGCASVQRPELGAGFFCDFLIRWWLEQPAFGANSYERENKLKSGGYTIISSLDLGAQAAAHRNVQAQLPIGSPDALMMAGVKPGTGHVQLMAVNRNFSNDQSQNGQNTEPIKRARGLKGNYPNTTVPLMSGGGDIVGYQAGSTFKIFTAVAALEKGLPLAYSINATSPVKTNYTVEYGSGAACPGTNKYCPKNANPGWMNGNRNMWNGFGRSVNTYFVPLAERIGAENAVDAAKRLGIKFRAKGTPQEPNDFERAENRQLGNGWGAFTLGVSATTPLDLAGAYAALAADGNYCEPIPVIEIIDTKGNKLDAAKPRCKAATQPNVARAAIDMARCPVGDQTTYGRCDGGTATYVKTTIGKPVAGKTGTTDGDITASLSITTKQLAIAATEADPDWARNPKPHNSERVNRAVANTMRDALANQPAVNFEPPPREIAFGQAAPVPNVQCQSVEAATATLRRAGFSVSVSETPIASSCPPGTVARTDPSGETVRNGAVLLYISRGPGAAAPDPRGGGGPGGGPDPGNGRGPGNGGGGGGPGSGGNDACRFVPQLCPPPRD
jgi:membrane peptidoglycan carboxypeptidase